MLGPPVDPGEMGPKGRGAPPRTHSPTGPTDRQVETKALLLAGSLRASNLSSVGPSGRRVLGVLLFKI